MPKRIRAGAAGAAVPELQMEKTMADAHAKHHDYHLVSPSPWPAVGATL